MTANLNQWGFTAPQKVRVPPEHVNNFLKDAPADTLILVDDETYRKLAFGDWRCLDTLTYSGGYNGYDTWESSTVDELTYWANDWTEVIVLSLPVTP